MVGAIASAAILAALAAVVLPLRIPAPTGAFPVGRLQTSWIDTSRLESRTASADDHRAVAVHVWFPATSGSGQDGAYLPNLSELAGALVASGELNPLQVWGLAFIRHHARSDARIASVSPRYPVIVLSPGNATNVAFYATIAEELASNGYVVVGVDHPYQVTAVALPNRSVATYDASGDVLATEDRQASLRARVEERVADLRFVLEQLAFLNQDLDGRLDLERVGVMGHSTGGIAAVEACRRDPRFRACLNIDGQQAGGPFSVTAGTGAPDQPFMFLTKETFLHPEIARTFEAAGDGAYRVVIPEAKHDQFADGALFQPTLLPFSRAAEHVLTVARGFSLAFFERHLSGAPLSVLGEVPAPTDVYVNIYPLGQNPPLPRA